MDTTFYVYRHVRHDTNLPFYVGIGRIDPTAKSYNRKFRRAFSKAKRTKYWNAIAQKTSYDVEILFWNTDFDLICVKEKEFIALYKRKFDGGSLVNFSEGGDCSALGVKYGPDVRQAISQRVKQHWATHVSPGSKRIYCYDLSGNMLVTAESIAKMAKALGFTYRKTGSMVETPKLTTYQKLLSTDNLTVEQAKIRIQDLLAKEHASKTSLAKQKTNRLNQVRIAYADIKQYTKMGELVKVWPDVKSITKAFNCAVSEICSLLGGYSRSKTARGFVWSLN